MKNAPGISVVIPLYNKGPYIARTLDSVLNQTYQNFEIIVVDDGSTDNGIDVVKGFIDPRIKLIRQIRSGVSIARNRGVNISQSNFIAFLDADDEWLPDHLENLVKLFKKFPNAGLVGTNYKIVVQEGIEIKPIIKNLKFSFKYGLIKRFFRILSTGYSPLIISSIGIRKDIFLIYGGFLPGKSWGEDHELWCRIALQENVGYCLSRSAIWHWDAENRLGNILPPLELEPGYYTVKNAFAEGLIRTEDINDVREYLAKKEIEYAVRMIKAKNIGTAIKVLLKCKTERFWYLKLIWIFIGLFPFRNDLFFVSRFLKNFKI